MKGVKKYRSYLYVLSMVAIMETLFIALLAWMYSCEYAL